MEPSSNSKVLFRSLVDSITIDETQGEIESIVYTLLRCVKGITREDILLNKAVPFTTEDFAEQVQRINAHEPIQYIVGVADFFGKEFLVSPAVLIPRPETEVLVHEAIRLLPRDAKVLDVGTGSGCIAISIALNASGSTVTAIEIDEGALEVARKNATRNQAQVKFKQHDVLTNGLPDGKWDMIVSNPPYVLRREAMTMQKNVLDFEPHVALFVPDNDPLVFYRVIAEHGVDMLTPGGVVLTEINEAMGVKAMSLFLKYGYSVSIVKDLDGKDRLIVATLGLGSRRDR